MVRLALVFCLVFSATTAACTKSSGPTTPAPPPGPTITEAPLTTPSLLAYMKERFPAQVKDGSLILEFGSPGVDQDVLKELAILGVETTGQLHAIVPADFETKGWGAIKATASPTSNVAGLMRDIMIIHDPKAYVEKAWNNGWSASGPEDFPAPIAYGVDMAILEAGGVFGDAGYGEDEGDESYDEGDPCGD